MTTFESVEAGWPQSRMSVRKPGQTQVFRPVDPSSPLKPTQEPEMLTELVDPDEPNPFDVIYTSQRPPSFKEEVDVEVDVKEVERIGTQAAWRQEEKIAQDELEGRATPKGKTGFDELHDDILDHIRGDDDDDPDSFEFSSKLTQMHSQRKQNTLLRTPGKTQRWDKTMSNTPVQHSVPFTPSKLRQVATPTKQGKGDNPYYPESGGSNSSKRGSSPVKTPVVKNLFARNRPSPNERNLGPRRESGVPLRNPFIEGSREQALDAGDVFMSDETIIPAKDMGLAQDEIDLVASRATMDGDLDGDSDDAEAGLDRGPVGLDGPQAQIVDPLVQTTGIKRHRESWDDGLEPTFKDDVVSKLEPTVRNSALKATAASKPAPTPYLAPTYVSQVPKSRKRVRIMSQEPVAEPTRSGETVASDTISTNSEDPANHTITNSWKYVPPPISRADMIETLEEYDQPFVVYQQPHFSVHTDVPNKAKSFGTDVHHLAYDGVAQLEPFEFEALPRRKPQPRKGKRKPPEAVRHWAYVPVPPDKKSVMEWLKKDTAEREAKREYWGDGCFRY